jgi:hypothetical protein
MQSSTKKEGFVASELSVSEPGKIASKAGPDRVTQSKNCTLHQSLRQSRGIGATKGCPLMSQKNLRKLNKLFSAWFGRIGSAGRVSDNSLLPSLGLSLTRAFPQKAN